MSDDDGACASVNVFKRNEDRGDSMILRQRQTMEYTIRRNATVTRGFHIERRQVTGGRQVFPPGDFGNVERQERKSPRHLTLETQIQDKASGINYHQVPEYWSKHKSLKPVKDGSGYACVRLSSGSVWHKEVSRLVIKTWEAEKVGIGKDAAGLRPHGIRIRNIFCIENPQLYSRYEAKKQYHRQIADHSPYPKINNLKNERKVKTSNLELENLESTLSRKVNEYFLLHGTKDDIIVSIKAGGLDSRLSGSDAMFGAGVYFTESSTKADQYADSKTQRARNGRSMHMFVCRVMLGSPFICQTPTPFRRPPCKKRGCSNDACNEHHVGTFDSVIGTHRDDSERLLFREFIVYLPDQSYPDFLVEYERTSL